MRVLTSTEVRLCNKHPQAFFYATRVVAGDRPFDGRALQPNQTSIREHNAKRCSRDEFDQLMKIARKLIDAVREQS